MTDLSDEDQWIADRVKDKSFMDLGGLWGVTGEKITLAHQCGASSLTMVDHTDDGKLWEIFNARTQGIQVEMQTLDIEDSNFTEKIGKRDVVHCNGLLYHSANPFYFLQQVASVTGQYLSLGSIHSGRYSDSDASFFIPNFKGTQLDILQKAYNFPPEGPAYGISIPETEWMKNGRPNARPFWWLHSKRTIQRILKLVGFEVEKEVDCWGNRVVKFLCRRKPNG